MSTPTILRGRNNRTIAIVRCPSLQPTSSTFLPSNQDLRISPSRGSRAPGRAGAVMGAAVAVPSASVGEEPAAVGGCGVPYRVL